MFDFSKFKDKIASCAGDMHNGAMQRTAAGHNALAQLQEALGQLRALGHQLDLVELAEHPSITPPKPVEPEPVAKPAPVPAKPQTKAETKAAAAAAEKEEE